MIALAIAALSVLSAEPGLAVPPPPPSVQLQPEGSEVNPEEPEPAKINDPSSRSARIVGTAAGGFLGSVPGAVLFSFGLADRSSGGDALLGAGMALTVLGSVLGAVYGHSLAGGRGGAQWSLLGGAVGAALGFVVIGCIVLVEAFIGIGSVFVGNGATGITDGRTLALVAYCIGEVAGLALETVFLNLGHWLKLRAAVAPVRGGAVAVLGIELP